MEKVLFSEKQVFPRIVVGIILFFTLAILIFAAIQVQRDDPEFLPWFGLVCLTGLVPVIMMFFVGVELKITPKGVYYRSIPFRKKPHFIPKGKLELSYMEATNFQSFGRYGMKTKGFNKYLLMGKHNLKMVVGKRTIVIGTKKPRELQRALEEYHS